MVFQLMTKTFQKEGPVFPTFFRGKKRWERVASFHPRHNAAVKNLS